MPTTSVIQRKEEPPPAPVYASPPADDEIRLRGIIEALLRRSRLIALVTVGVAAAVAAILLVQPPRYKATALLMISPTEQRVLAPTQQLSADKPDATAVDSQVEVLKSRAMAVRVARNMKLARDPAWNPGARAGDDKAPLSEDLTNRVRNAIDARRRGLTDAVEITTTAPSPEQAAQMANTVAAILGQMQVETADAAAARANEWLQQRLSVLRDEVRQKDELVEAYRVQNGLMTADGVTLTEKQISDVQASVLAARADLAEKTARYDQAQRLLQAGGSASTVSGVLSSDVIRDLRTKQADIMRRLAEAEKKYGDKHPTLQSIRAEKADIEQQIADETQRITESLKGEMDVARARVGAMERNLSAAQGALQMDNAAQVKLDELQRDAAAARAVFESFLQRSHEITQQGRLGDTDIRLVSAATPPSTPSSPRIIPSLAIALALGLGLALVAALIAEHFDDTIDGAEDLERKTGFNALVSIPVTTPRLLSGLPLRARHPAGYVAENPMSALAEAFRVLRASIVYAPGQSQRKIVAVTSALPGEGKTTSSLCLARIAAMSGEKVILVDCDLRRRGLNDLLDIDPEFGLLDVLSGARHWLSAVGRDEASGAHVLPVASSQFTPRDLFGSPEMKTLINDLSSCYDMIILDCAPILAVAETRILTATADTVILVSRARKTPTHALVAAVQQIEASGGHVGGVAVNRVDFKTPGRRSRADALYYSDVNKVYYNA